MTQEELMAKLQEALTAGDFKAVARISKEIAAAQAESEKAEKERTANERIALVESIRKAFKVFLKDYKESIGSVYGDGLWCAWNPDNQENPLEVRITKKTARAGGGGGGGKKFAITTEELLTKQGSAEYKEGVTCQEAFDSDTAGNSRYRVRVKMLKLEGLM
jgi:hypothetical protein